MSFNRKKLILPKIFAVVYKEMNIIFFVLTKNPPLFAPAKEENYSSKDICHVMYAEWFSCTDKHSHYESCSFSNKIHQFKDIILVSELVEKQTRGCELDVCCLSNNGI